MDRFSYSDWTSLLTRLLRILADELNGKESKLKNVSIVLFPVAFTNVVLAGVAGT